MNFLFQIKRALSIFGIFAGVALMLVLNACNWQKSASNELSGYLFTYFKGNGPGEEAIHFAVSLDGYYYRALNNNEPVLDSKEFSTSGGMRDPHILRGADGKTFYMVATDLYVPDQEIGRASCWERV